MGQFGLVDPLIMTTERTFIMAKPDAVQRGLVGEIMRRFERRGFKLVNVKCTIPTDELLEKHYCDLTKKPFFPALAKYMVSGPVVAMVFEGLNAVKIGRDLVGTTDPSVSPIGTIRGDFCLQTGRNLVHGSDSVENAKKEIKLWFGDEVVDWTPAHQP